jgi:hypothetical protein
MQGQREPVPAPAVKMQVLRLKAGLQPLNMHGRICSYSLPPSVDCLELRPIIIAAAKFVHLFKIEILGKRKVFKNQAQKKRHGRQGIQNAGFRAIPQRYFCLWKGETIARINATAEKAAPA